MPAQPHTPPPAYFLSLSLENVRSFGDKQTISFARPDGKPAQWTIILGDNGVGKTTVLKALAALRPVPSQNIKGVYEPAYSFKNVIKWNIRRNANTMASMMSYTARPGIKLTQIEMVSPKPVANHIIIEPSLEHKGKLGLGTKVQNDLAAGLVCYGYGAGRTVGNSTIGENPANDDTCISLFDDRADLLNPEEWFLNIDYGSKLAGDNAEQLNKARTLVEEMLKKVLLGVTELRIASTGTPQKPQISLEFLLFDTWVRLRDMSLGYQTLVVWLTDFASKLFIRYPDSPNPLEEPAIVLIDEIDLHLHPSWQRKLLGFLSDIFQNTQFIATAHSPLVVQAAGDEGANVVLLRREGDQTVVVTDVEDVRGWRVDQILTSSFYNLDTARSLETEKKLARQATLLNKQKLNAKERQELDALTLELEGQPMGSTGAEEEEAELLRQITARLQSTNDNSGAAK